MHVVREHEERAAARTGRVEGAREYVLAGLDRALPVEGVEVRADDVVAKRVHDVEARRAAREVRRPHVCRRLADDAHERRLELRHLGGDLRVAQGRQVRVVPRVRGDLVALGHHALDQGALAAAGDVVGAPVPAVQEKGRLHAGSG